MRKPAALKSRRREEEWSSQLDKHGARLLHLDVLPVKNCLQPHTHFELCDNSRKFSDNVALWRIFANEELRELKSKL